MNQDAILNKLEEKGVLSAAARRAATFGAGRSPHLLKKLIKDGAINEDDLLEAALEVEPRDPRIVIASDIAPDADAIMLIPGDLARRELVLPVKLDNGALTIIVPFSQMSNVQLQDDIKSKTKIRTLNILASSSEELSRGIEAAYRAEGELRKIAADREASEDAKIAEKRNEVQDVVEESAASKFVQILLSQAVTDGASDIHIEQSEHSVIVRFRTDGVLHDISDNTPKAMAPEIITRIKILADMDISERRKPLDGRLSINHPKRGKIDFRVASLPTVHGEKIVMRILDNSQASMELSKMGFSEDNLSRFQGAYSKPYGMILVTGPTGSGKSTTLYAALNDLVTPEVNIITVEDPVEYKIPRINQVQVNVKAGLTFAAALRSILRADPDIVLIGEIRDSETAHIAAEAAQTGHLVLSTLHTNDAPSAVARLVDLGVEPFIVGSVVESILGQRLIRRLCSDCKELYTPEADDLRSLEFPWEEGTPLPQIYRARPKGCKNCSGTGYRGRTAIHEVLRMSPKLERVIVNGGNSAEIAKVAKEENMKTLREDGWKKTLEGTTSIQEVLRVVN